MRCTNTRPADAYLVRVELEWIARIRDVRVPRKCGGIVRGMGVCALWHSTSSPTPTRNSVHSNDEIETLWRGKSSDGCFSRVRAKSTLAPNAIHFTRKSSFIPFELPFVRATRAATGETEQCFTVLHMQGDDRSFRVCFQSSFLLLLMICRFGTPARERSNQHLACAKARYILGVELRRT